MIVFPIDKGSWELHPMMLNDLNLESICDWKGICTQDEAELGSGKDVHLVTMHNDLVMIMHSDNDMIPMDMSENWQPLPLNQSIRAINPNLRIYGTVWVVGGHYNDKTSVHTLDNVDAEMPAQDAVNSLNLENWQTYPDSPDRWDCIPPLNAFIDENDDARMHLRQRREEVQRDLNSPYSCEAIELLCDIIGAMNGDETFEECLNCGMLVRDEGATRCDTCDEYHCDTCFDWHAVVCASENA